MGKKVATSQNYQAALIILKRVTKLFLRYSSDAQCEILPARPKPPLTLKNISPKLMKLNRWDDCDPVSSGINQTDVYLKIMPMAKNGGGSVTL